MAAQSGWWLLNADNAAVCAFLCLADRAAANLWQEFLMIATQAGGVNRKQDRAGGEKGRDEEKRRERERTPWNKWWPLQRWICLPTNVLSVNTCYGVTFTQRQSWRHSSVHLCAHSSTLSPISWTDNVSHVSSVSVDAWSHFISLHSHVHLITISCNYVGPNRLRGDNSLLDLWVYRSDKHRKYSVVVAISEPILFNKPFIAKWVQ